MENVRMNGRIPGRNGLLYPMLVIAAIAAIIFSAVGVAMMTGLLPRAESVSDYRVATSEASAVVRG